MTLSCGAESSPLRRAWVVSGSDAKAAEVSRAPRASPMPVPVLCAIHDAAERCPSSRHTMDWAARWA